MTSPSETNEPFLFNTIGEELTRQLIVLTAQNTLTMDRALKEGVPAHKVVEVIARRTGEAVPMAKWMLETVVEFHKSEDHK